MLYAGYYDESDDGVSFSVAGYAAPCDTWVHLDWAWQDLLKRWGVEYFKASECENGLGEFAQYRDKPEDRKSRLKPHEWKKLQEAKMEFINAICGHADYIRGNGAVASHADFNKIIGEDRIAHQLLMDNPYYICLQATLIAAAKPMYEANVMRRRGDQLSIRPVFDSHEQFSEIAKIAYDKFRAKNTRSATVLLPLAYDDDKSTSALQVADVLAYEVRKYLSNSSREMRKPLLKLLPTVDKVFKLNYASLRTIVDNQRPDSIAIQPERID